MMMARHIDRIGGDHNHTDGSGDKEDKDDSLNHNDANDDGEDDKIDNDDDKNLSVFGHGELPLLQSVFQLFWLQLQLLLGLAQVPDDDKDDGDDGDDGDDDDDDDDDDDINLLRSSFSIRALWSCFSESLNNLH